MITDARYGITGPLFRCDECRFLFVLLPEDPVKFYSAMVDGDYEDGRHYRSIQQRRLLARLLRVRPNMKSMLDVGAGTGMLVEVAGTKGIEATGIEPSEWASGRARVRGLNVLTGTLPHPSLGDAQFDAITLIDVIEHVVDPVGLLTTCGTYLRPDGILLVVTPDVRSIAARLMGWRWWHYRIAHLGYFSVPTIELALRKADFQVVGLGRPSWDFDVRYLYSRLRRYLPIPAVENTNLPFLRRFFSTQITLTLGDSIEVVACRR
jgi:SAM-dependent methyltransferase